MSSAVTVSVMAQDPLEYHPITLCAVASSRPNQGHGPDFVGPFTSTSHAIDVVDDFRTAQGGGNTNCGIPNSASAVAINVVSIEGRANSAASSTAP